MAKRFLEFYEVEKHRKVFVASMHLGGDAALWMRWYEDRYPRHSWITFSEMLRQHFDPGEALNFNVSLSHIKQAGFVRDYIALFIKLSCRAHGWSNEQLMGVFIGGLRYELQDEVLALNLASLAKAMELAQLFENRLQKRRQLPCFSSSNPQPQTLANSDT